MDKETVLGLVAGLLTTVAFVPQVLQVWRTRSARDVSFATFSMFAAGVFLWIVYGIAKGELPIILWNGVTLVLAIAILAMKLRFR